MNRRTLLTGVGFGVAGGLLRTSVETDAATAVYEEATRGLSPLKITSVRCIRVLNLNVVKVETSEPGLYGLGCATFQQRPMVVETAVKDYLAPFATGRNADNIEDLWQTAYTSSYWRNGPVLNNALSGLDQALWDIKGKRAGMPVYQLLGGKCRFAADTYRHCNGRTFEEVEQSVREAMEQGFRHVRIQLGGYGAGHLSREDHFRSEGFGEANDQFLDTRPYLNALPKLFEHIRKTCGEEIELLHDIHERVLPMEAIRVIKELEPYRPFFIEDPFAPEANGYFEMLRSQTSVPLAMGELFNNPHEWTGLITNRLIDYIRVHISQVGGLSVARKIAALAEWFGVRTAWHGPSDVSPCGHAANVHLDLAIPNFGIQEAVSFSDALQEVFPGCPWVENGYLKIHEAPGLGVDLDEGLARKLGARESGEGNWLPLRRRDGSSIRP